MWGWELDVRKGERVIREVESRIKREVGEESYGGMERVFGMDLVGLCVVLSYFNR